MIEIGPNLGEAIMWISFISMAIFAIYFMSKD